MIVLFVISGFLWIVAFGWLLRYYIRKRAEQKEPLWNRQQRMWQSIFASRRQHLMAYWALSMGVFTVFAVGLCRPDFTDANMIGTATGGYQLYIDSRVPVQYDLNNQEVRHKLNIDALPDDTRFLHFMRHSADEASCLNLNKVEIPTVLGIELSEMCSFGLTEIKPSDLPAVYIDEEALIWSMMKSPGDTILYTNGQGQQTSVLIAGSYPTGIFHGNAIMSDDDFRLLWPEESGIEVLLVKTSKPAETAELLSIAMNEYGLLIQTTEERIRMFFEVTDTYLLIFLTLGGLGLLLGIFSLIIIVRKNLTAQQSAIQQYLALGFSRKTLTAMLLHENLIVPFYAILAGGSGALISISANVTGAGIQTLCLAAFSLALLLMCVYWGIRTMVVKLLLKS